VVLLVALGVFPHPLLDQITPSIQQLLHHVAAVSK
jgi:NADH:ubiquinone oxidoreductase subunit 4 (subunit M)